MPTRQEYIDGSAFEDEIDPTDPNFRLIRMRVAHPAGSLYQCEQLTGERALRKMIRGAAAQLAGAGAIPEPLARHIVAAYQDPE